MVGFYAAADKMRLWIDMVGTMQGICTDGNNLFRCPDVVMEPSRLLYQHQDSMLLLVTILVMHESMYKSAVDLLYDGTGHSKIPEDKTGSNCFAF